MELLIQDRSSHRGVLCNKVFLKISQNSQENICARVSFLLKWQALGLFSSEFCEISKNTFLTKHLWETASVKINNKSTRIIFMGIYLGFSLLNPQGGCVKIETLRETFLTYSASGIFNVKTISTSINKNQINRSWVNVR